MRDLLEQRPDERLRVPVLVRVEVRRRATYEGHEALELPLQRFYGVTRDRFGRESRAPPRQFRDPPSTELDVQADAKLGSFASVGGGLRRSRPLDHEAGARHDSALVRLDDPSVDASANAEVVGVDDDELQWPTSRQAGFSRWALL
jgi:hypothetical protein